MTIYYSIPFIFLFFSRLFVYVLKYSHFLLILLRLESAVLSLYILLFFYVSIYSNEYFIVIFFLSIRVCERALGLALLVFLIRTHGNDIIIIFDNLW